MNTRAERTIGCTVWYVPATKRWQGLAAGSYTSRRAPRRTWNAPNTTASRTRQAASGGGIALVSTHYTARRLERNELEIVLPDWHRTDDVELHVLYPRRATLDSKVRAFVEFLAEVFDDWRTAP